MSNLQCNVSLYEECPAGTENTFRCSLIANERLKLYQIFQQHEFLSTEQLLTHLENSRFLPLLKPEKHPEIEEIRRMDRLSHWILRIAYGESNYHWLFIKNELRWFKIRFNRMSYVERSTFLKNNNFVYLEPTEEEKVKFKLERWKWRKVKYTRALSLLKLRVYPLHRGYLFLPEHKLIYCVLQELERKLKNSLIHIQKTPLLSWPDQLKAIVGFLKIVKPSDQQLSNPLRLSILDENVHRFPLCMQFQYENLKQNHHLKHPSRIQYGLFLKGIGLPLEEALKMWQEEFSKQKTPKNFTSEYLYFFKHQYGTVGSLIQYVAQSCDTIRDEPVGFEQVNGCPFKHWDVEILTKRLIEDDTPEEQITKIIELKAGNRYKEACTMYFQCIHQCQLPYIIEHPVEYYEKSCKAGDICDIEDLVPSDLEN